jgi:hypothetical protein
MKRLLFLLTLIGFTSCDSNVKIIETPTQFTIDSVQYHGVGSDNTLQVSPYWKLHLTEPDIWIRSNSKYEKGDKITVRVRVAIKNPTPDWYNYTH